MADHKLISCVGYSLRLARRQNQDIVAHHLLNGLCSLTKGGVERFVKPISLCSALGLDKGRDMDQACGTTVSDGKGAERRSTLARAEVRLDQTTQTETQMMSMEQFHTIISRIERDLIEKLSVHMLPATCPTEPNEPNEDKSTPASVCHELFASQTSQCDSDQVAHNVDPRAAPTNSSATSSTSREEAKRRRRETRKRELEAMAGLTPLKQTP
eukprot:Skav223986  [mRNA]  locus=scaffold3427:87343:87981:- [translate_table: standard]